MNKLFRYNEFVVENVQAAKALLKKIGKSPDDTAYKQIIQWLGNALGYAHWFVKQHFQNGATLEEIKQIIDTIKAEKAVIDKFSTPVIQLENCEKFWDEYLAQSRNAEAKAAYNEFPARQKRFLDLSNSEDIQMLKDLSNDDDKKTFLKKLASFTNRATLIQNLKNFLYQKTSKVTEELLNELRKDDVNIVYADIQKEIIITTVDYSQIVKFCSDTAWCIVRSEHMFDSYVTGYDYFTLQFVIFLPGRSDIRRKIGVTRGISKWITAHDVQDARVDESRVYEILKEYDVKDPENIFLDEVKKQIKKRSLDFDIYPVSALISAGFSKEEIIQKKNIYSRKDYRRLSVRADLSFFTEEEIEKWNLRDKTQLSLGDIIFETSENIVKKKLWLRVPEFKFEHFYLLPPIDYDTAIKIAKEAKFKQDDIAKTFIRSKRDNLKKKLGDYYSPAKFCVSFLRTEEEISQDLDIPFKDFLDYVGRKIVESQLGIKNWTEATFTLRLLSQYYKLDLEKIKIFQSKIELVKTITELDSDRKIIPENKLGNEQEEIISLLKEYLISLVLGSDVLTLSPEVMKEIEKIVSSKLYKEIFDKQRELIIKDGAWKLHSEVTRTRKLDFDILRFWKFDKTIPFSFWNIVFSRDSSTDHQDIHDYFLELGYDVKTDEYFNFISKAHQNGIESGYFWIFALKNGLVNQSRLEQLLDITEKGNLRLFDEKTQKIESLLDEDAAAKFRENWLFSSAKKITKKGNIYDPDWLETFYPILKRNKDKIKNDDFLTTLIVSLAKLKAEPELSTLDIKINNISTLKELAGKVIGIYRWQKENLEEETKKLIWKYLEKNVVFSPEDKTEVDRIILPLRWIFDRKNIDKWLEEVKKVKNNESYHGVNWREGTKKRTNRMYALSNLLAYLAKENKAKDISEVFSKFTFNKFEKKWLARSSEAPGGLSYEFSSKYTPMTREIIKSIWDDSKMKKESWIVTDFKWFKY